MSASALRDRIAADRAMRGAGRKLRRVVGRGARRHADAREAVAVRPAPQGDGGPRNPQPTPTRKAGEIVSYAVVFRVF